MSRDREMDHSRGMAYRPSAQIHKHTHTHTYTVRERDRARRYEQGDIAVHGIRPRDPVRPWAPRAGVSRSLAGSESSDDIVFV